jgi:hypothetical protein
VACDRGRVTISFDLSSAFDGTGNVACDLLYYLANKGNGSLRMFKRSLQMRGEAIMKNSLLVAAMALSLVWAGVASAAPLAPPLGPCIIAGICAGEGAAPNTAIPPFPVTAVQHLDWVAMFDGNPNGGWSYYYQVENSSGATLTVLNIASTGFLAAGFIAGGDLDLGILGGTPITPGLPPVAPPVVPVGGVPAHTFAFFGNLTLGGVPGIDDVADGLACCFGPSSTSIVFGSEFATFLLGLGAGSESGVIVGQGLAPV